jgi:hypothetical protein
MSPQSAGETGQERVGGYLAAKRHNDAVGLKLSGPGNDLRRQRGLADSAGTVQHQPGQVRAEQVRTPAPPLGRPDRRRYQVPMPASRRPLGTRPASPRVLALCAPDITSARGSGSRPRHRKPPAIEPLLPPDRSIAPGNSPSPEGLLRPRCLLRLEGLLRPRGLVRPGGLPEPGKLLAPRGLPGAGGSLRLGGLLRPGGLPGPGNLLAPGGLPGPGSLLRPKGLLRLGGLLRPGGLPGAGSLRGTGYRAGIGHGMTWVQRPRRADREDPVGR